MGGFATVSLYTHRIFSFGALIAMMIASSGDEAFIMLAMIPEQALILFVILFVIAIAAGIIVDTFYKPKERDSHDFRNMRNVIPKTNVPTSIIIEKPSIRKRQKYTSDGSASLCSSVWHYS